VFNAIRLAKEAVDHRVLDRIQAQYQRVAMPAAEGD
jgi:glycerol-3-phosphate acyltransferase PlsX